MPIRPHIFFTRTPNPAASTSYQPHNSCVQTCHTHLIFFFKPSTLKTQKGITFHGMQEPFGGLQTPFASLFLWVISPESHGTCPTLSRILIQLNGSFKFYCMVFFAKNVRRQFSPNQRRNSIPARWVYHRRRLFPPNVPRSTKSSFNHIPIAAESNPTLQRSLPVFVFTDFRRVIWSTPALSRHLSHPQSSLLFKLEHSPHHRCPPGISGILDDSSLFEQTPVFFLDSRIEERGSRFWAGKTPNNTSRYIIRSPNLSPPGEGGGVNIVR